MTLEGFPAGSPDANRKVHWSWPVEPSGAGAFADRTQLYLAPDEQGVPRWWRQVVEDSVNAASEPEQITPSEALSVVEPVYLPVLFTWTLEAFAKGGHDLLSERWEKLVEAYPSAPDQLRDQLLALLPDDPSEE